MTLRERLEEINTQLAAKWRAADEAMGRIEAAIAAMEKP